MYCMYIPKRASSATLCKSNTSSFSMGLYYTCREDYFETTFIESSSNINVSTDK